MLPYFRSMEAFYNLSLPKDRQSLSDRQLLFFFSLSSPKTGRWKKTSLSAYSNGLGYSPLPF